MFESVVYIHFCNANSHNSDSGARKVSSWKPLDNFPLFGVQNG